MEDRYKIKDQLKPNGVIRYPRPSKEKLLEHYAQLPVRGVLQVDAIGVYEGGARIYTSPAFELSFFDVPVRVSVAEGTSKDEVLFYLAEIAKTLDEDWQHLDEFGSGQRPRYVPPVDRSTPEI